MKKHERPSSPYTAPSGEIPALSLDIVYTMPEIVGAVERATNFSLATINKDTRKHEVTLARHALFYYLYLNARMNLRPIGGAVRPKKPYDHTTVISGKRRFRDLLDIRDKEAMHIAEQVARSLNPK